MAWKPSPVGAEPGVIMEGGSAAGLELGVGAAGGVEEGGGAPVWAWTGAAHQSPPIRKASVTHKRILDLMIGYYSLFSGLVA